MLAIFRIQAISTLKKRSLRRKYRANGKMKLKYVVLRVYYNVEMGYSKYRIDL